jgi:hypothetical protein
VAFRTLTTLAQVSGVEPKRLPRLVCRELADNALDAGREVEVGYLDDNGSRNDLHFFVEDDGDGLDVDDVARLFSFKRPRISSKLLRLPTRGALGNGLRVVAGAVYASGGSLRVVTRGHILDLFPQQTGATLVQATPRGPTVGTRVEVRLGEGLPEGYDNLLWAQDAIRAAGAQRIYKGKTSVWWYCSDSFFELLQAAGQRPFAAVWKDFDHSRSEDFTAVARRLQQWPMNRPADSLTYDEAEKLLELLREAYRPVEANRFALLGADLRGRWGGDAGFHAKVRGSLTLQPGRGSVEAEVPFTVECWGRLYLSDPNAPDDVTILVNRTPVAADVLSFRPSDKKNEMVLNGCNLRHRFTVGKLPLALTLNVQAPFVPITSTGKQANLQPFLDEIKAVIEQAARKAQRAHRAEVRLTAKENDFFPRDLRGQRDASEQRQEELQRFAQRLLEMDTGLDFARPPAAGPTSWKTPRRLGKATSTRCRTLSPNAAKEAGLLSSSPARTKPAWPLTSNCSTSRTQPSLPRRWRSGSTAGARTSRSASGTINPSSFRLLSRKST